MAKRVITSDNLEQGLGAVATDNKGLQVTALVATGACVAAPTAVVLGSLQTTFIVGGAVASAAAYGQHRINNGESAWPFKKEDDKKEETTSKKQDDTPAKDVKTEVTTDSPKSTTTK